MNIDLPKFLEVGKKLNTIFDYLSPHLKDSERKYLDEYINLAAEYGHAFWMINAIFDNDRIPIPQSIYNLIVEIGEYFVEDSKRTGILDVKKNTWESLKSFVVPD